MRRALDKVETGKAVTPDGEVFDSPGEAAKYLVEEGKV